MNFDIAKMLMDQCIQLFECFKSIIITTISIFEKWRAYHTLNSRINNLLVS